MKVTFLGTGPMQATPRFNCQCFVCKDARKTYSKSKRTRSSVILNYKNINILIDASPDILRQVKQNKIVKINAVLITHPHQDAIGGIKQLNKWLKSPIPIYCQKQTWRIIKNGFENLIFTEIKPNIKFKINNLPILPLKISHSIINENKFPTLAFKIEDLIYCSDVKKIPAKSLKYFKNTKILILDAAMYFNRQIFSHLNTADAINLANKLRIKNLYLTQIGHSYPPFKEAQNEILSFIKDEDIKVKVNLAFDNQKIIL